MPLPYTKEQRSIQSQRVFSLYYEALKDYENALTLAQSLLEKGEDLELSEPLFAHTFSLCNNLYGAVEESLRIILSDNGRDVPDEKNTTFALCVQVSQFIDPDKLINLACLVMEKKERNLGVHRLEMPSLPRLVRVINNLQKILEEYIEPGFLAKRLPDPMQDLDFSSFFMNCGRFEPDGRTYLLITDPLPDATLQQRDLLTSLPWDIVLDFDGASKERGLRSSLPIQQESNVVDLYWDKLPPNLNSHPMFRTNKLVWFYLEKRGTFIPSEYKHWLLQRKEEIRSFIKASFIANPSELIVVCTRAYDESVRFLVEELRGVYSHVRFVFVNQLEAKRQTRISEILSDDEFAFYPASIHVLLDQLNQHQRLLPDFQRQATPGIQLPGKEGNIELSESLAANASDFFEILHLNMEDTWSHDIEEERKKFLRGDTPSWPIFADNFDVKIVEERTMTKFINGIRDRLDIKAEEPKSRVFEIRHRPGFGGTTLSRRIAWDLHRQYPVLVLKDYRATGRIATLINNIYNECKKGLLIVADENYLGIGDLENLEQEVLSTDKPLALLLVKRVRDNRIVRAEDQMIYLGLINDHACRVLEERYIARARQLGIPDHIIAEKREQMRQILTPDMMCPFIIGLYYLDKEFTGVKDYVRKFLEQDLEPTVRKTMVYIAMADYFGAERVPSNLVTHMLNQPSYHANIKNRFRGAIELFVHETRSGGKIEYWRPRHFLLGKELMAWSFETGTYTENWQDMLPRYCLGFIDEARKTYQTEIPTDISGLLTNLFVERVRGGDNGDLGDDQSRFSHLIEEIPFSERRVEILRHLAETHDRVAHYWAHLARFYSEREHNFVKAEEACDRAIELTEAAGKEDPVIYHIKGVCIRREAYERMKEPDLDEEKIHAIRELVDRASVLFNRAAGLGQVEFGVISHVEMIVSFLTETLRMYGVQNYSDLVKLQKSWLLPYFELIDNLLVILDKDDLNPKARGILSRFESRYRLLLDKGNYSDILQDLYNHHERIRQLPVSDSNQLAFLRRAIIDIIIQRSDSDLSQMEKRDVERILSLLEENIESGKRIPESCSLWLRTARYSDTKSTEAALSIARTWYHHESERKIKDPKPAYYMYVLQVLRCLEGYKDAIHEALRYLKECKDICATRRIYEVINLDKIRDWYGPGRGTGQLVEGSRIDVKELDEGLLKRQEGVFTEYGHEGQGRIELNGVERLPVFFKPSEAKLTENQLNSNVSLVFGFSYDGLIAHYQSVRNLDTRQQRGLGEVDRSQIAPYVVGDEVDLQVTRVVTNRHNGKKFLLVGTTRGTGQEGSIHISEVDFGYVTDEFMESFQDTMVQAVVIAIDGQGRLQLSRKRRLDAQGVNEK